MNDKEYAELPGIRRSDLWKMNISPLHFKYAIDHPKESSPALVFGQAAHKYILEPDSFWDEFAVYPNVDRRTKAGKEEFAEFQRNNADKTWITADDFATIAGMRGELFRDQYFADLIESGEHEVPFTWTDEETGERLKMKADIVDHVNHIIYDYKTAQSCADGAFQKAARRYGYDFQAGFYTSGVEADRLETYAFGFIGQEKTPPYAVRLYICDRGFIIQGKHKFRRLLNLYHECKQANDWFGYIEETLYSEEY